ncbi:hypothetical protein [Pontixanthobacter aquaemixtae]|uniref:Uncharacterized protein n=1 Tax=Pontixanthobacter aquaemixtae TaxID=1958940 RepID=A0A845A1Z3_9SPHN|nr:hypothetical protein [Pontixanthobacter aquaemixtae]MXO91659.1 hypothetical protein [Pontixanthobacter aquaemixtae]
MTRSVTAISALAALATLFAMPAAAEDSEQAPLPKGEAELAELLDGYQAGEPVKCLRSSQRDRLRVIDDTALVFRDRQTIYVNRTNSPRFLDTFDVPVFKLFGNNLCRHDQIEMYSRDGRFTGPIVTLSDFVPYTKVDTAD